MGQQLLFLVYSGSTQNLVIFEVANRVYLKPNSNGKLEVLIALDEKLVSPGRCA